MPRYPALARPAIGLSDSCTPNSKRRPRDKRLREPFVRMSRLLVVEDEAHIASGLRFNLEADGHTVVLADTGEAALATIAADWSNIDLVVLDVMLPGIDGFTVASRMRTQGSLIPILMLTARGRAEDVLDGFEAGADDYLQKPFELSILIARINALL